MARAKKAKIEREEVRGLKHLRRITGLLQCLHGDATARDKAHNRMLFFDQYAALVLLAMFSPAIDSLRAIQQASAMPKVRKLLGCSRVSLGSLSEAARVFDPALLQGVIAELSQELVPLGKDPRLKDVKKTLTLCDGTLLAALPRLAQSMWKHSHTGNVMHGWRMHCQFELERHVPTDVQLTPYRCQGDEQTVLQKSLHSGRCHVMDRGYFNYALFDAIVHAASDYVCRVKHNIGHEVISEREVTREAKEAGVRREVIVHAGSTPGKRAHHPMRLIEVHAEVQPRGARGEGKPQLPPRTEVLLIATNLLDVPAEVIALVYRYRWSIELFFRFFKQILRRASPPAGLPPPHQRRSRRHHHPVLLRRHRLHAAATVERPEAQQRDALPDRLLPVRLVRGSGRAGVDQQAGQHRREAAGTRGVLQKHRPLSRARGPRD